MRCGVCHSNSQVEGGTGNPEMAATESASWFTKDCRLAKACLTAATRSVNSSLIREARQHYKEALAASKKELGGSELAGPVRSFQKDR
ncbi:hypothetical protein NDU88_002044 [Pleurodeles waltl]|uniref:Uncharacterized protein n=1 Tax=Pleurodeles waltl TaxID=8319 RepID=A0AAV7U9T7_PLEWA|nr:hypothetical protein NDU88_002044 [Pleurodeles waltl]